MRRQSRPSIHPSPESCSPESPKTLIGSVWSDEVVDDLPPRFPLLVAYHPRIAGPVQRGAQVALGVGRVASACTTAP